MSTPTINKHPKYYFDDGNVVFLTSDKTLFRLHKSILRRHSTFFNDMFEHAHPPTKDSKGVEIPVDGSSDDHPIELGGHALATLHDDELESICAVLYDMPLTPSSELQVDQAVSLLKVASKFQFGAIHSKAVQMLDKALLPPGQRYRLAIDCLVDSWIVRSYVDICSTVDPISTDLVADFSMRNESNKVSALMMVRENHRAMLLVFVHGSQFAPYPSTAAGINTNLTSVCANCLPIFKQLLLRILQNGGHSDLDGADATKLPLLEDRMLKGIQPRSQNSLAICATCRAREKAAVAQILGTEDLVKEVKKVMHLVF